MLHHSRGEFHSPEITRHSHHQQFSTYKLTPVYKHFRFPPYVEKLKNIVENLLHYPPPISFFSLLYRQIDHFSTFLPFYAPSFNNVSNQMLKFFFFSMFFLSLSLAFSTRLCYNKYILI